MGLGVPVAQCRELIVLDISAQQREHLESDRVNSQPTDSVSNLPPSSSRELCRGSVPQSPDRLQLMQSR